MVGVVAERLTINVAKHQIEIQGRAAPITCKCSAPGEEDVESNIRAGK